jgi:hypothetical protein
VSHEIVERSLSPSPLTGEGWGEGVAKILAHVREEIEFVLADRIGDALMAAIADLAERLNHVGWYARRTKVIGPSITSLRIPAIGGRKC